MHQCNFCDGNHPTMYHNCELCTRLGHNYGSCPNNQSSTVRCQLCGNNGHTARSCSQNNSYRSKSNQGFFTSSHFFDEPCVPAISYSLSRGFQGIELVSARGPMVRFSDDCQKCYNCGRNLIRDSSCVCRMGF